jgi:uncharacterized repeat protein (TIGR01451 family)
LERLEDRLTPGSANPANVTAIYDYAARSLSVSFQEAIGSKDTPVYGAAFLGTYPTTQGGISLSGITTNGSKLVTFQSDTTTLGLLVGQTVTGTGILSGTTIASVDSSSQVTLSKAATATSLTPGTSLTFTLVLNGTLASGSKIVTGLSSTAGLFVGESLAGTGIPIPQLPSNPTQGTPETGTRIASIGADGHSITLTANATASGTQSLTFITGLALDGSGMEFMSSVVDNTTVYTQTYSYSSTYQNPFLLTPPPDVCMTLYHDTGATGGSHSVVGDGPGLNSDNSLNNNNNSGDYQVYSGLLDYTLDGKAVGSDDTPTTALNGMLTTGSTTVTGLSSTSALYVGEYVTGSGLPAGDQVASIVNGTTITLSAAATATGGKNLTFDTATVAGYRIIHGEVDLNRDGAISNGDTTSTLAGNPQFNGFNVISGKIDLNGNGKIDSGDTGGSDLSALCATPTVINYETDLSITKSDGVTTVTAGDGIVRTYTITVTNNGPAAAQNVSVTDTWPAGFTEGTITDAYGTVTPGSGGKFTAALGTITPGASKSIKVTYTVLSSTTGDQTNTVTVTSSTLDSNLANNTASDTDHVLTSADLSITKSDGVTTVTAGDGIVRTYTITVTNNGPSDAQNVSVADTWPAGFTEGTITDAYGNVVTGSGGNFTAALGTMGTGTSKSIYVTYTVPSSTTGDQTNTATVSSSTPDSNLANNTTSDTDHVLVIADLAITKTDNSPTYSLGSPVTYVITVTNNGPSDAVGATVADIIPAMLSGVTWTSSTTGTASVVSGGSGAGNSLSATVNIASGAGNSVVFKVTGTTPSDWCTTGSNLVNTATVSPPPGVPDPNLANNSATDIDTFGPSPITVTSAGDDPLGPIAGTVTLRDAINAVNAGTGTTIRFAISGTPTINLSANLPTLNHLTYIDGTTEPGVLVNGNGYTMEVAGAAVNIKDVQFTDVEMTVDSTGTLNVESDFHVGDSSTVTNYGHIDVCGSFLGGNSTGVLQHGNAAFQVDVSFIAGDNSYLYNFDTSSISVPDDFTLGIEGFVYNGFDQTGNANLTVGHNLTIGDFGFVYNSGTSSLRVTNDFALGNSGFLYNGGMTSSENSLLTVGGNFTIGDPSAGNQEGYVYNSGFSTFTVAGDFILYGTGSFLYNGASDSEAATLTIGGNLSVADFTDGNSGSVVNNFGASTLTVAGSFSLNDNTSGPSVWGYVENMDTSTFKVAGDFNIYGSGSGSFVFNGGNDTSAATLSVGGSLHINSASATSDAWGYMENFGTSTINVARDFAIYGDGGSYVYNGVSDTNAAVFSVGGSFSLGANSFVYDYGTSNLSVTGNFSLAANSFFVDYGTMSVSGVFDPGTGNPYVNNTVAGTFTAASGSSVTTNTSTWEVLAGGQLDVAAGATFTVGNGGTLLVSGNVTVEGLFVSLPNSLTVIEVGGALSTQGAGQLDIQGTLVYN